MGNRKLHIYRVSLFLAEARDFDGSNIKMSLKWGGANAAATAAVTILVLWISGIRSSFSADDPLHCFPVVFYRKLLEQIGAYV